MKNLNNIQNIESEFSVNDIKQLGMGMINILYFDGLSDEQRNLLLKAAYHMMSNKQYKMGIEHDVLGEIRRVLHHSEDINFKAKG